MLGTTRKASFRLLPIVALFAAVTLVARVGSQWVSWEPIPEAQAQEKKSENPNDESSNSSDSESEATLQDAIDEERESSADEKTRLYTQAELDVLENLSARREFLEGRSRELDLREHLLVAAQDRVEEKVGELKRIERTIRDLLQQHDEQEKRKLLSLVRVYESMKSKDAARIFEELELDILVDVAELMEERRLAPVLAAMDPVKAKTVTVEIRTRRRLPEKETEPAEDDGLASEESVKREVPPS